MASTLVKKENNTVEFKFEIDVESFEIAMDKAFKKNAKYFNIPGFRKGKAPRKMVEKMYGEGVLYEDAINFAFPEAYDSAIDELQLEPVSNPELDIDKLEKGQPVVLIAKVTVKPEVTLGQYKGIEIKKPEYNVTAKDVDAEISKMAEKNARMVTVEDRAVKKGDIANIDFEGFKDGIAFDGGKGEKFDLTIGSGQFIPGFEDQLIGAVIGEEKEIEVTFPEDYQAEELKGQDAQFNIKLHEIKTKELPELDDEFVKDVSDKETVEDYKKEVKETISKRLKEERENDIANQITDKLIELVEGEIPEVMYDNEVNSMIRDFDARLRSQGMDMTTYLGYMGMDADALKSMYRKDAERRVKLRLALKKIAQLENIVVTDEEVDAEFARLAETYGVEVDRIKMLVDVEDQRDDIAVQRAMDVVKSAAAVK